MSTSESLSIRENLSPVLAGLADVLDGIEPTQLDSPTPCTEFTVTQLREHVVGWLTAFTDGYRAADGRCSNPDAVQITGTGAEQVREVARGLDRALAEGAAERPLWIAESSLPGEMAAQMMLWEYQMHGWDLAVASGQTWKPPVAGVEASLAFAPAMLTPDYQGEGKPFAPQVAVADGASPLDHLLGLSGRDPGWAAR
ncbi:MAG: TIGR03086 family metal-binding protein [Actinomycetales bacterium]